ncbi:MAG: hypothetical protein ATN36_03625 [Epulopiscium sp. Nele67-Bin005]|nr:MAG: hypothetical protein ATN36_03625 [Epulopiscium sp. Nele67-Bin005]
MHQKFYLSLLIISTLTTPIFATSLDTLQSNTINFTTPQLETSVQKTLDNTANYILETTPTPQFGVIGGEWAILGLARSNVKIPDNYFENYYNHIEKIASQNHTDHSRGWSLKVTETQRLALTIAAIGKDPTNVNGVDLVDYSYNKANNMPYLPNTILGERQGLNELIFGLMTMQLADSYTNSQDNPDSVINTILTDYKTIDGGFNLSKENLLGDIDITAMTIQALAPYYNQTGYENVTSSIDNAVKFLYQKLNLTPVDELHSENLAQTIVALCSIGINPNEMSSFNIHNSTLINLLLNFSLSNGAFEHVKGEGANQMATEQSFYSLVAYERFIQNKTPLYKID